MVLQVFDRSVTRSQVDVQLIVYSLARIFNIDPKVRDIVLVVILSGRFIIMNDIGSFDRPSHQNPFRRCTYVSTAHFWYFIDHDRIWSIQNLSTIEFFSAFNYLSFMVFELHSWKYSSKIVRLATIWMNNNILKEAFHLSDDHFAFYLERSPLKDVIMSNMK